MEPEYLIRKFGLQFKEADEFINAISFKNTFQTLLKRYKTSSFFLLYYLMKN